MKYYPVFLNLKGKKCVVIGGGVVAERKVFSLLDAGGSVTVVSPELTELLSALKDKGEIEHIQRGYQKGDLMGAFLVIAATSRMDVNRKVFHEAKGLLVNVVDVPELCSFIVPSLVTRGPLTVAISTSGISPSFAKSIREELEELYPEETSEFLAYLDRIRKRLMLSDISPAKRNTLLKKIGDREALEMLRSKGIAGAKKYVTQIRKSSGVR